MKEPIVLNDAIKTYTKDQDKILSPEETVKNFRARLAALDLDILESTVRIDNGRLDIPVFFSICGKDAAGLTGTKKQMGKGATPAQAEASAVMELAERFSFFSFVNNEANFIRAASRDLDKEIMPFELIAKSVEDESDELLTVQKIFEEVPFRWTPAFNLTSGHWALIPFDWFFAINEFNGPSAGNCKEEAICQGICEIVERHVSSVISRNKISVPLIDPASATDPAVIDMIRKYEKNGIKLFLSDFTLAMGIPTVGALAYDPSTFPEKSEIVWTAGTTPDPEKALSRGLTEVAQLAGDFNTGSNYVASGLPKFRTIEEASYITSSERIIPLNSLPDISDMNIRVEIENLLSALSKRGYTVWVIETTHPQLGIPAFYTIIPGAQFRERAAGGSVLMFLAKGITEKYPPREAARKLSQIESMLPGRYFTSFYLGMVSLNQEDPAQALKYFETALSQDPPEEDAAGIYSYMGVCLKEMGRYEDAVSVLEKGIGIDDERTDLHNLLGFCLFKLKDHRRSIECFKRVLSLNPSSAIDYANIGSNYSRLGEKEKAIHYFGLALALDPGISFARDQMEELLSGQGSAV